MLPYKNLLIIDKENNIAVFKQIALQFIRLIQEGKLLPGTALPSTRTLAFDLELHRKTVTAAYECLVSEDWVDSVPRKGFVVSPNLPVVRPRTYHEGRIAAYESEPGFEYDEFVNFSYSPLVSQKSDIVIDDGFPDVKLLPVNAILQEYRRTLNYRALKKLSLGWELEGSLEFRDALCNFLNVTRGLDIEVKNLLTTRGAQMAIYVAASIIIKPGDKVIVGEPSYLFASMLFERLGAELIRIPVDNYGMQTEIIEEVLKTNTVKLMYVIPHHHHPTTVTMSVERRNQLLQLIKKYQIAVIEDDYDYDFQFQYDPYLPLASGNHDGNIIYIGSLTKVLGTPFRLGYIVAAEKFIKAAAKKRMLVDLRGDVLNEQVVSGLIKNGELTRLIQKANKLYRKRCHFLSELLNTKLGEVVEFKRPTGGMAIWLCINSDFELTKILDKTAAKGLKVIGSTYNKGSNAKYNAFRFGFGSLNVEELEKAVEIFKTTIDTMK